jgi:hypothetical protein
VLRRALALFEASDAVARASLALLLLMAAVFCDCGCDRSAVRERISNLTLSDLSDHPLNPFAETKARTLVFVFVAVDCPISNRYAPELKRLHARFGAGRDGMQFWLVYPDAGTTSENAKRHLADYDYTFGGLRDPKHALVKLSGATVTPEAAVFTREGHLLYCGRIDDRFPSLGTSLVAPTQHDLADALAAIADGRPVRRPSKSAVGCSIGDAP